MQKYFCLSLNFKRKHRVRLFHVFWSIQKLLKNVLSVFSLTFKITSEQKRKKIITIKKPNNKKPQGKQLSFHWGKIVLLCSSFLPAFIVLSCTYFMSLQGGKHYPVLEFLKLKKNIIPLLRNLTELLNSHKVRFPVARQRI